MTTYTVTINGETYLEVTPATLKTMRKNNKNVKAVKSAAQKFWYYRGTMVTIGEERQCGYTMVDAVDGSFFARYAITAQLEYR